MGKMRWEREGLVGLAGEWWVSWGDWMCGRVWGAVGFEGAGVGVWGDGCVCVCSVCAEFCNMGLLKGVHGKMMQRRGRFLPANAFSQLGGGSVLR